VNKKVGWLEPRSGGLNPEEMKKEGMWWLNIPPRLSMSSRKYHDWQKILGRFLANPDD
jgi:hypothetical protein